MGVAVEATNLAITLTSWFDEEITADSTVTVDDMVKVSCSIDNPEEAHPVPDMVLKAIGGEEDGNEELISDAQVDNGEVKFTKNITRSDQGKEFICESRQNFNGEDIFSSSVSSEPLQVVLPPIVMTQELPESYIIDQNEDGNETIVIPIRFSSIPMPTNEDIVWEIASEAAQKDNLDYLENDANETDITNSSIIMNPNDSHPNFLTYPIESVEDDFYLATIEISNITSNLSLFLKIANEHGDLELALPKIIYIPEEEEAEVLPVPPPNVKTGGISIGIIIGIIFILIILIVLIGAVGCYAKRKKPTKVQNVESGRERGKDKPVYDLDNMPDDKLQTLDKKLYPN